MDQHFVPHSSLYGIVSPPAPKSPPPAPPSPYQQLKDLDELLDREQARISEAQSSYAKTLEQFATLCHQLWEQEKAQGSRAGKGFRRQLEEAGIKVGRAYRAMKKFFPADFPARRKRKAATSSAANKVANPMPFLRFTRQSKIPACPGRRPRTRTPYAPPEVLELAFALTPAEKTEFLRCLKVVGAGQLPQLLLQAMKQAAEAIRTTSQTPVADAPPRKPPRSDPGSSRPLLRKPPPRVTSQKTGGAPNKTSTFMGGP